jgi:formylglycine-generating enzyme required for sulfatase activity
MPLRSRGAQPASGARLLAVVAGALVVLAACAKVAGIDGLEIGECKGGPCGAEAGGEDAPVIGEDEGLVPTESGSLESGRPCPGLKGPAMVRVGTAVNNFCIDSTEVTVAQYREFTSATPDGTAEQPPECAWNASFAPAAGGAADDLPITGVDWCDARAYCAFAGKRLCGKQKNDTFAGSVMASELADFNTNEWLLACSNVGALSYPYGGIHQPKACNTGEADAGGVVPVHSKPLCQGGFTGVYDMVGNVWEWIDGVCSVPDGGDAAAGPGKELCIAKGNSYLNSGINVTCRPDGKMPRDRLSVDVGIRCCSD